MKKRQKTPGKFECIPCDFKCSKQCDWDRHISTRKHDFRTELNKKNAESLGGLSCKFCGKTYSARNSLWYHQKKCDDNAGVSEYDESDNTSIETLDSIVSDKDMLTREILLQLLKNSQELVKITKEKSEAPTTITNNTTNTQFNVNFFLNEKCKDAINFTDFVNSITLSQADLQTVVKHGNVEGNSRIIADMLEKLGVYRRPIHCTDMKRETVYIRENDEWEKEQVELPRIKKLADMVSHKVIQQSNVWHEENPDFMKDAEKKEESLRIMTQIFGSDFGGEEQSQKKVIKNILHRVEVDKTPEKIIKKTKGAN